MMSIIPNSEDYDLDEEYRHRIQDQVEKQHLIHAAVSGKRSPPDQWIAAPSLRPATIALVLVILLIMLLLSMPMVTDAQSGPLRDHGNGEPFAPAMLAYRMANFYYVREDYERAMVEFTKAIEAIPVEVFARCPDYGVFYWGLVDTQLAVEDYEAAQITYQTYLDIAGDNAMESFVTYVDTLDVDLMASVNEDAAG